MKPIIHILFLCFISFACSDKETSVEVLETKIKAVNHLQMPLSVQNQPLLLHLKKRWSKDIHSFPYPSQVNLNS